MARIFQLPQQVPIVGGSVSPNAQANFYLTGTTTRTNTYTDAALTTPHTNPVLADAAGVFPVIYLDPDVIYRLVLNDEDLALIYDEDPIQDALTQANIGRIFHPRTDAEVTAGVIPTNYNYLPGDVRRYGAVGASADNSAALQASIDQCINGGAPVSFQSNVTYLMTSQVTADSFEGLVINGNGATIDNQVDNCFQLGDHTVDGDLQYTQTTPTASRMVIRDLEFKPSVPGFTAGRFAHQNPISLSAVSDVEIVNCRFEDWDFAAIGLNAPSEHVRVHHCRFYESLESDVAYGVRPFAFVDGAALDAYDEVDGDLAYVEPTNYHKDIVIRDNYFYQCSHSILSWNVHGFSYKDNTIEKPLIRGISMSNWNFDGLASGNKYLITNNTDETLSTAVVVGTGSERVTIDNERFQGAVSGTGVNNSLKVVQLGPVASTVRVQNCIFDVSGIANNVVIDANVEADILFNDFRHAPASTGPDILINNSPATTPTFDQPTIRAIGNKSYLTTRFLTLNGDPPGTPEAVIIEGNVFKTQITDGLVATNTASAGWQASCHNNNFEAGFTNYDRDFGAGVTQYVKVDDEILSGTVTFAAATTAAVTIGLTLSAATYHVTLGSGADRTFWWSGKTATGFTLNAALSNSDTVDWRIVV